MKIAIPTDDGVYIAGHFGRTRGFKIFEIQDNQVVSEEHVQNRFTGHAQGLHQQHQHQHRGEQHQQHSHAGIFAALGDCKTVIANGMGRRLYNDFNQAGIQVFITRENKIQAAVQAFISGTLDSDQQACCDH